MEDFLIGLGLSKEALPLALTYITRVGSAALLLIVALILSGVARSWTTAGLKKINFDPTLTKFLSNLMRWFVLLVAGLACLSIFGIETTSVAGVLAGASLAVGLAFQGTLSNVSAGVMLLTFRPFKIGDVINVAGQTGGVEEISLFTTTMNTPDNKHIIVPNSAVFGATITNITHNDTRRVDISVGVDYDADIDETRKVLEGAIKNIPSRNPDGAHQIFLSGLGGSSVDWQVRIFGPTDKYWDIYQETIRATKNALDAAEIGIPYPNVVVHNAATDAAAAAASKQG